jgi:hypothetical protein
MKAANQDCEDLLSFNPRQLFNQRASTKKRFVCGAQTRTICDLKKSRRRARSCSVKRSMHAGKSSASSGIGASI